MRRRGVSTRDVEKRLGISRSTLSYWFRKVRLHPRFARRMKIRNKRALIKARIGAVKWHNGQKAVRLQQASHEANMTLSRLDCKNDDIAELALALLYLGEGMKTSGTALGNSDPLILRFFIKMIQRLYQVESADIKCELHLRADQDPIQLTRYWSKMLKVPIANFRKPSIDKRTIGRPTYAHYKGVCIVTCGRVAIQRKLVYIAATFCNKVIGQVGG